MPVGNRFNRFSGPVLPSGAPWDTRIHGTGLYANRPAAAPPNKGLLYFATDISGGTLYRSDGTVWTAIAPGVTLPTTVQNVFHNADFAVAQRGTSFAAAGTYTLDRWIWQQTGSGAVTVSQDTDVPTLAQSGYLSNYSLKIAVTTADGSIAASDYYYIGQAVEGYDYAKFIGQQAFALSFWVKASKTGTYCVSFGNSGANRCYTAEYTVNAASTWEFKTVLVTAPPSAGTWNYTTGVGLLVAWIVTAGSTYQQTAGSWVSGSVAIACTSNQVNGMDSNTNTFAIAQPMLSVGTSAAVIVPRPYMHDLALCQRYALKVNGHILGDASQTSTTYSRGGYAFPVTMRATPTLASTPAASFAVNAGNAGTVSLSNTWAGGTGFVNGANNWTVGAIVTVTAMLTADL